ncbi:MAG: hypothetical protein M5R36_13030 [Deltaproteobacteria bacterium]|nr:hypothetical protein [Deltaproteobacteria bacterium]
MQRKLEYQRRSDLEEIKDAGLTLDWDEIAKKGKISPEEVQIAKWYGIYSSRQEGAHMARVVVPGGQVTSKQARDLADIAERYAQGKLNVTTRQSIQMHWLKLPILPDFLRDLRDAGLTTFHGCGDVTRNVAACPWASVCEHRRVDVLPFAQETARELAASRDLDNLPRKFKISYSGCGANCGQPHINCVGVTAVVRRTAAGEEETGFRVAIGGGMGWKAFVGKDLFSFVPKEIVTKVCRAVGLLFRDHGDRYNRATARLKFVVKRYGIDRCREIVLENLRNEGVDVSEIETKPVEDTGPRWPARPLTEPAPRGTDGLALQRVMLPKGEVTHAQLKRLAELADIYGDKHLYNTNRQNIEIHGVRPEKVEELKSEVRAIGLAVDGFYGLQDVVPCVGTTYCPLAVSRTHDLYDLLQSVVHQEKYAAIRDKVLVNITGCPNACSPYRIADIGFRGMRIREMKGSVEAYEVRVGGDEDRFGEIVGEYKLPDCVLVTARLLDTFMGLRQGEETLADSVKRVGAKVYREAVDALTIDYTKAPNLLENSAFTGMVSEPRDFAALAKDIPCQEACPAKTNVPEYIRLIAEGDHDEAYRINQEDNVFPGVLGRICTRPCETACRYNWTNTETPVQISPSQALGRGPENRQREGPGALFPGNRAARRGRRRRPRRPDRRARTQTSRARGDDFRAGRISRRHAQDRHPDLPPAAQRRGGRSPRDSRFRRRGAHGRGHQPRTHGRTRGRVRRGARGRGRDPTADDAHRRPARRPRSFRFTLHAGFQPRAHARSRRRRARHRRRLHGGGLHPRRAAPARRPRPRVHDVPAHGTVHERQRRGAAADPRGEYPHRNTGDARRGAHGERQAGRRHVPPQSFGRREGR